MREPKITMVRIADNSGKVWELPYHDYGGVPRELPEKRQQSLFNQPKKHIKPHKKRTRKFRKDEFSSKHGEVKIIRRAYK